MAVDKDKRDLLAYAFDAAQRAGAVNWNYIGGVMRRIRERGIQNIDQAYDYDAERDQRMGRW